MHHLSSHLSWIHVYLSTQLLYIHLYLSITHLSFPHFKEWKDTFVIYKKAFSIMCGFLQMRWLNVLFGKFTFSSLLHLQLLGAKSVLKQDHHPSLGWPGTHYETKAGLELVAAPQVLILQEWATTPSEITQGDLLRSLRGNEELTTGN